MELLVGKADQNMAFHVFNSVRVLFGELPALFLPPLRFHGANIFLTCFFFIAKLVKTLPREKIWEVILVFKASATTIFSFSTHPLHSQTK